MNSKQRYVIVMVVMVVGSALKRVVTERNFNDLEFEKIINLDCKKEMDLLKHDYTSFKNFTETNVTVLI